jgi:hypothetical protein
MILARLQGVGTMEYQKSRMDLILGLCQNSQPGAEMPKIYFDSNPELFKMIRTLSENAQKYLKPRSNSYKICLKSWFATILWHHILHKRNYIISREKAYIILTSHLITMLMSIHWFTDVLTTSCTLPQGQFRH